MNMQEIIERYKKAIDEEDWYTIEKIQKEKKATSFKRPSLTGLKLWDIIRL